MGKTPTLADVIRLRQDPHNLNKGTERGREHVKQSMELDGFGRPVFAAADGTIIGGNHALQKAREAGINVDEPLVVRSKGDRLVVHVREDIPSADDPRFTRMGINDNRSSQLNFNPDLEATEARIQEVQIDPAEVGYTVEELRAKPATDPAPPLRSEPAYKDADAELDKEPPPESDVPKRTRRGDVWQIGPHRIMCGDARDAVDVHNLLRGRKINLSITSPPYADRRDYDPKSGFEPIPAERFVEWWEPLQALVMHHLAPNGSFFVNIKAHSDDGQRVLYVLDLVLAMVRKWGWKFVDDFCWRRHGAPGRWENRLRNGWEPVYHFSNGTPDVKHDQIAYEGNVPVSDESPDDHMNGHWNRSAENTRGVVYPENVIEAFGVEFKTGHTAAFPVRLPLYFIDAFSDPNDLIYDPFVGSGTSIVAANERGRIGFGMELSPRTCDRTLIRLEERLGAPAQKLEG
jgi:site-specific DNA-methyltransferase (adenine-specific)